MTSRVQNIASSETAHHQTTRTDAYLGMQLIDAVILISFNCHYTAMDFKQAATQWDTLFSGTQCWRIRKPLAIHYKITRGERC